MAERMATDPRRGLGIVTDDDVALLFLRYQREFNRHACTLLSLRPYVYVRARTGGAGGQNIINNEYIYAASRPAGACIPYRQIHR